LLRSIYAVLSQSAGLFTQTCNLPRDGEPIGCAKGKCNELTDEAVGGNTRMPNQTRSQWAEDQSMVEQRVNARNGRTKRLAALSLTTTSVRFLRYTSAKADPQPPRGR